MFLELDTKNLKYNGNSAPLILLDIAKTHRSYYTIKVLGESNFEARLLPPK